jgi:hypothetical protein
MHDKDDRCPGDDDLTQRVIIIRKVIGLIHDGICFYITYIHHAIPRNFQVAPSIVSFHSLKTLLNKVTASQEVHSSDFTFLPIKSLNTFSPSRQHGFQKVSLPIISHLDPCSPPKYRYKARKAYVKELKSYSLHELELEHRKLRNPHPPSYDDLFKDVSIENSHEPSPRPQSHSRSSSNASSQQ